MASHLRNSHTLRIHLECIGIALHLEGHHGRQRVHACRAWRPCEVLCQTSSSRSSSYPPDRDPMPYSKQRSPLALQLWSTATKQQHENCAQWLTLVSAGGPRPADLLQPPEVRIRDAAGCGHAQRLSPSVWVSTTAYSEPPLSLAADVVAPECRADCSASSMVSPGPVSSPCCACRPAGTANVTSDSQTQDRSLQSL